jgi:hypothetical protein
MSIPGTVVRLSTYTLGDEIETCKARMKKYTQVKSDIPLQSWIEFFNKYQTLIYRLSGLKDIDNYLCDINFTITGSTQVTRIKLSNSSMYKFISKIHLIKDSLLGVIHELPLKTFEILCNSIYYNPRHRKTPIWARDGEYINIGIGDLNALGTVTVKIYRTPLDMVGLSDLIDLPNENVPELEDFVLITALQQLNEPVPAELEKSESRLKEMEKQAIATKQEHIINELK